MVVALYVEVNVIIHVAVHVVLMREEMPVLVVHAPPHAPRIATTLVTWHVAKVVCHVA